MSKKEWTRAEVAKEAAVDLLSRMVEERPLLPLLVPIGLFAWAVERWLVPLSNWIPLFAAVWATVQYGNYQRRLHVDDLNKKWRQLMLNTSPVTPLEPCQWLNMLLVEVWRGYMEPKLSLKFFSIVEKRLKHRKPKMIEKVELQDFSLGSCPPNLGQHGVNWITSGDKRVMRLAFDWDTNEISILLLVKLAKPLGGTARIIINSLHIKGNLLLIPILDGQAVLYSFESTPEIRVGVAFGTGGSQSLPATVLPGVSSWLVKLFTETITKFMVEPRRQCFSLPPVDLRKKAAGGILSVSVISATLQQNSTIRDSLETGKNLTGSGRFPTSPESKSLQTFVEVEIGNLTRRTSICDGMNPIWDATFNAVLHGDTGLVKCHLYHSDPSSVRLKYLTSCEIKVKYVADDSTVFWAIGHESGVVVKRAEFVGEEVKMVIPFEDADIGGELTLNLVLKEWHYSEGLIRLSREQSQPSVSGASNLQATTGRKLKVTISEGRDLWTKDKNGKCDPYVKLQYGKVLGRTKTISSSTSPVWNQDFEFEEIGGGEYLKLKCFRSDIFGDENLGSARLNLEGLLDGSSRDVWIPLEKVNSGELRIQIEAIKNDDNEILKNTMTRSGAGWIELILVEAKDLVAADLRGTSDPFVKVQYGNEKRRTKVIYKTLAPLWNQTLEFPDDGSSLTLHVKDHNALLPESSIGHCTVEYKLLPPNQTADKWIPLQGVKTGEIRIKITRRVPELQKKLRTNNNNSSSSKGTLVSTQVSDILRKLYDLIEEGDLEGLLMALSEAESAEYTQGAYMLQLEKENQLLMEKISELGHEIKRTASVPSRISY